MKKTQNKLIKMTKDDVDLIKRAVTHINDTKEVEDKLETFSNFTSTSGVEKAKLILRNIEGED